MTTMLSFIVVLGIIVLVHELGHYLAAKLCGMRVEKFSIGFGKAIFSKTIGDTEYKIAWIPLGGYVKISGMVDESLDPEGGIKGEEYEFESKNAWQKGFVISAGVMMNFLLAILIYTGLNFAQGEAKSVGSYINDVFAGSAAETAGLIKDDEVVSINTQAVNEWADITNYIQQFKGNSLNFTVKREQQILSLTIIPEKKEVLRDGEIVERYFVGIGPRIIFEDISIFKAFTLGVEQTWMWTKMGVLSLKMLVTGEASLKDIGGPIAIAKMSGESASMGFSALLLFLAFISINIGFLNILPIPILDGGHLLYIFIEGLSGRKIKTAIKFKIQQVGMALLFMLMIIAVFNDISRLFTDGKQAPQIEKQQDKTEQKSDK